MEHLEEYFACPQSWSPLVDGQQELNNSCSLLVSLECFLIPKSARYMHSWKRKAKGIHWSSRDRLLLISIQLQVPPKPRGKQAHPKSQFRLLFSFCRRDKYLVREYITIFKLAVKFIFWDYFILSDLLQEMPIAPPNAAPALQNLRFKSKFNPIAATVSRLLTPRISRRDSGVTAFEQKLLGN